MYSLVSIIRRVPTFLSTLSFLLVFFIYSILLDLNKGFSSVQGWLLKNLKVLIFCSSNTLDTCIILFAEKLIVVT
jgi:hypothetical protein